MRRMQENITVIGTGFVGLTTALLYSKYGHRVIGLGIDDKKIANLSRGKPNFYEPGLNELLNEQLKKPEGISFTTNYEAAISTSSIIIICVGTPALPDGSTDLSCLEACLAQMAPFVKDDAIIIIKSTVPVGTSQKARSILRKLTNVKFSIASMPEFLREGKAIYDTFNPSIVLIGANNSAVATRLKKLNRFFDEKIIISTSPNSAQMIKYANNAYGAMRIAFINEIATLCEHYDANIDEVLQGLPFSKTVSDYPFYPGLGYGGSCFPKDVKSLASLGKTIGHDNLFAKIDDLNENRPIKILEWLGEKIGGGLQNKTIAVLGLSFKPDTDDQRFSPAQAIIPTLLSSNCAIRAYDPKCKRIADDKIAHNSNYHQFATIAEAINSADIIMPLIEWTEIVNYSFHNSSNKKRYFADMRNQFDRGEIEKSNYIYYGVGRNVKSKE